MSIRRTATLPQIEPDDLQFSHRGREFGIEITDLDDMKFLSLFERVGGAWGYVANGARPAAVNRNLIWDSDAAIEAAGGAQMWIGEVFLPWFNALLADVFEPLAPGQAEPPSAAQRPIDQVQALLPQLLRLVAAPDGTLKAVLK